MEHGAINPNGLINKVKKAGEKSSAFFCVQHNFPFIFSKKSCIFVQK
jgi:hypothetical protein